MAAASIQPCGRARSTGSSGADDERHGDERVPERDEPRLEPRQSTGGTSNVISMPEPDRHRGGAERQHQPDVEPAAPAARRGDGDRGRARRSRRRSQLPPRRRAARLAARPTDRSRPPRPGRSCVVPRLRHACERSSGRAGRTDRVAQRPPSVRAPRARRPPLPLRRRAADARPPARVAGAGRSPRRVVARRCARADHDHEHAEDQPAAPATARRRRRRRRAGWRAARSRPRASGGPVRRGPGRRRTT